MQVYALLKMKLLSRYKYCNPFGSSSLKSRPKHMVL
jgi:hypothetical protein